MNYSTSAAYYTGITPGSFLLLGSWASNVAELAVAPFMVIFSYTVAREFLHEPGKDPVNSGVPPPFLSEIMRGSHGRKDKIPRQADLNLRVVNVAGFGFFAATLLTVLVITGDNWLHVQTHRVDMTHYEPITNFSADLRTWLITDSPSFSPIDDCSDILQDSLPQNQSSAPLPCSLNRTNGLTNIANPSFAYQTLSEGISQINSSFNRINFTHLVDAEANGDSTPYQIVTTLQQGISHSMFFNPDAAVEYDMSDLGLGSEYGIDYVANTTSMTTQCKMATRDCSINATSSGSIQLDQNNISIPFHCYDDFSGNLGQTPSTGHERAQGWNMSFYDIIDGSPRNIPVQAQSNPFNFYLVTAVNSISFQDAQAFGRPEAVSNNGSLVDVGGGFSAFALNCEATIHDVKFSLVNGSIHEFHALKASPQKASIIKAPLQVGFGQFHLYESAHVAVLPNDQSIANTMSTAFSQVGMALASGAFDFDKDDNHTQARLRWTTDVTRVPKAPFWFLVVVCLVYSVFGMVMTVVAFVLRQKPGVRDEQARLIVRWGPELQDMSARQEKRGKGRNDSDGDSLDFS
ncbi:hypothetical protein ACLMJK_007598 [Lecanora helva]